MANTKFLSLLKSEVDRLDTAAISKRAEKIITGFTSDPSPKAIIGGSPKIIFNSNDYLGLRFHPSLKAAEHAASDKYGTGPGAVRFISGSLQVHLDLEAALAKFHSRPAAQVISSAFATNLAVISSLLKGQSADSLVSAKSIVFSDALNHRSIVDAIRLANLSPEQKQVYPHLDTAALDKLLSENAGKFDRGVVITDGVFSMLGEIVPLKKLRQVVDAHQEDYPQGVILIVDDCHGIGVVGKTGRGVEEAEGANADVLIGTLGKAFGADGGYVTADSVVIDYLRESAATYIYSNSISPGTAGAALASVTLLDSPQGGEILEKSRTNIQLFKKLANEAGLQFAADSTHAIQPLLIGDSAKSKQLSQALFAAGFLVSSINYPVVAKGRDEIRVQISAIHTADDITSFVSATSSAAAALKS